MNIRACHRCGSYNIRADRSLAGRLICSNCGVPQNSNFYQNKYSKKNGSKFVLYLFIGLLIALLCLIIS